MMVLMQDTNMLHANTYVEYLQQRAKREFKGILDA